MAIIISSPASGSIRIQNTAASPMTNVLCNLYTVNVIGDPFQQAVAIQNSNGQVMQVIPISQLTTVSASVPSSWTLQNAVDAISSLIID